jgi:hypothetical protein
MRGGSSLWEEPCRQRCRGQVTPANRGVTGGRDAASLAGLPYNRLSTLASAPGRPSKAFGPQFTNCDGPFRIARLPAPPFNFVTRFSRIVEPSLQSDNGVLIETEYDILAAWYYRENGAPVMPIYILIEAAIQPCGWRRFMRSGRMAFMSVLFRESLADRKLAGARAAATGGQAGVRRQHAVPDAVYNGSHRPLCYSTTSG